MTHSDFGRTSSLVFVIGLAILAPIVFLLLPVVLGVLHTELGLGETQLGLLATIELLGIAVGATTGIYWTPKWNWQTVARISIAGIAILNFANSAWIGELSFGQLLVLRTFAGLFAGTLAAIAYSFLAHHPDTERAAGFLVATQTAVQVAGLYLLPLLIALPILGGVFLGAKGVFLAIALFAVMVFVLVPLLPTGIPVTEAAVEQQEFKTERRMPAVIVLTSFLLFFVAQTAVWGFLELFGADAGVEPRDTTLAISLSTAAAVFGPLFASVFGNRFGQIKPLIMAGALQFVGLGVVLGIPVDFPVLLVGLGLFQVGWTMALPYHIGVLADVDPSHRFIVLTSPAQAVGIALGPTAWWCRNRVPEL